MDDAEYKPVVTDADGRSMEVELTEEEMKELEGSEEMGDQPEDR